MECMLQHVNGCWKDQPSLPLFREKPFAKTCTQREKDHPFCSDVFSPPPIPFSSRAREFVPSFWRVIRSRRANNRRQPTKAKPRAATALRSHRQVNDGRKGERVKGGKWIIILPWSGQPEGEFTLPPFAPFLLLLGEKLDSTAGKANPGTERIARNVCVRRFSHSGYKCPRARLNGYNDTPAAHGSAGCKDAQPRNAFLTHLQYRGTET
ncbi:serine phosphatase, SpoIIE domain-containing [Anopheles sinensis]|uniref:Serine phosphatase, SpoIIE domain-containing n=1 Tax=Anopheles sinensis TaxID=74873 RepID=A0A084VJD6_ANOSI|nr:serine phosphatase, SpoIIE domain-containing [Anopheles sinensis]